MKIDLCSNSWCIYNIQCYGRTVTHYCNIFTPSCSSCLMRNMGYRTHGIPCPVPDDPVSQCCFACIGGPYIPIFAFFLLNNLFNQEKLSPSLFIMPIVVPHCLIEVPSFLVFP